MDDSDKKIVSDKVDYEEVPDQTGQEAFNMKEQRDKFVGGGESIKSSEAKKTPTEATNNFWGRFKDKVLQPVPGMTAAWGVAGGATYALASSGNEAGAIAAGAFFALETVRKAGMLNRFAKGKL